MAVTVPIVSIPCHYGGERQYFRCPSARCSRRCEVSYSWGAYFLCRKCCGYHYPSQLGDELDQLHGARCKIGERIFQNWDGNGGWLKRKGMHWTTFSREHQKYKQLEDAWQSAFYERAKALMPEAKL